MNNKGDEALMSQMSQGNSCRKIVQCIIQILQQGSKSCKQKQNGQRQHTYYFRRLKTKRKLTTQIHKELRTSAADNNKNTCVVCF